MITDPRCIKLGKHAPSCNCIKPEGPKPESDHLLKLQIGKAPGAPSHDPLVRCEIVSPDKNAGFPICLDVVQDGFTVRLHLLPMGAAGIVDYLERAIMKCNELQENAHKQKDLTKLGGH